MRFLQFFDCRPFQKRNAGYKKVEIEANTKVQKNHLKETQIEKPSKTLIVEGEDAEFYQAIKSTLNKTEIYNVPSHFQINIISLDKKLRNKSIIKQTLKAVKGIRTFYGIDYDDNGGDGDGGR